MAASEDSDPVLGKVIKKDDPVVPVISEEGLPHKLMGEVSLPEKTPEDSVVNTLNDCAPAQEFLKGKVKVYPK